MVAESLVENDLNYILNFDKNKKVIASKIELYLKINKKELELRYIYKKDFRQLYQV